MPLIEKIARAVFRSNFHPDEDEALVATLWNEWPDDRRDAERAAQAALTAIMDAGDGVQQCDRDAAIEALNAAERQRSFGGNGTVLSQVCDIFARHRSTAAAAERARIVAWLRGPFALQAASVCHGSHAEMAADAIERGEV